MAKKKNAPHHRKGSRKASVPSSRKLPDREVRLIHRPEDIALSAAKLFAGKKDGCWSTMASDKGYFRIRPVVSLGVVGLCGSLALGNPPSPDDNDDAWEVSKPADCWDYWEFLDFVSVPAAGKKGGLNVILFHARDSFQDAPLRIVGEVYLGKTEHEQSCMERSLAYEQDDESKTLVREWDRLRRALQAKYGTADLRKQTWKVGKKVYDVTFPDE
jgi:hypothetical protein